MNLDFLMVFLFPDICFVFCCTLALYLIIMKISKVFIQDYKVFKDFILMKRFLKLILFAFVLLFISSCRSTEQILKEALASKNKVTELRLGRKGLTEIPKEVFELTNLEELILYKNNITEIPPEIGKLKKLKRLALSRNKIKKIAPEIGNLTNLENLTLYFNEIDSLPEEIGNLKNLDELNLAYNNLTKLPASLGNLNSLEILYLGHNHLTEIPKELGKCDRLVILNIGKNDLKALPRELGDIVTLNELNLSHSGVMLDIPESLCNLRNLQILTIDNTAILPYCLQGSVNPRLHIIVQ